MDHIKVAKEHLLHLVFGVVFFSIILVFAVALDLASRLVLQLGVTPFTGSALELSAHALLVMDLVLFFVYVVAGSIELVKGMTK